MLAELAADADQLAELAENISILRDITIYRYRELCDIAISIYRNIAISRGIDIARSIYRDIAI